MQSEKLQSQTGVEIDRRKIDLDEPLKRIGIYPIKVRLMAGLEPMVNTSDGGLRYAQSPCVPVGC